jgi:hypothetical protein
MADPTRRNRHGYDCALQRIRDGRWVVDPDAGTIWSSAVRRLLRPNLTTTVYPTVSIWVPRFQHRRMIQVHLVIWESVHGPISDLSLEVNHIDGNKRNSSISNLELLTPLENIRHAMRIGLTDGRPPEAENLREVPRAGVQRNAARLTTDQVIEIRTLLSQGLLQKDIAKQYGTCQANVSRIWRGETWMRVPCKADAATT